MNLPLERYATVFAFIFTQTDTICAIGRGKFRLKYSLSKLVARIPFVVGGFGKCPIKASTTIMCLFLVIGLNFNRLRCAFKRS